MGTYGEIMESTGRKEESKERKRKYRAEKELGTGSDII